MINLGKINLKKVKLNVSDILMVNWTVNTHFLNVPTERCSSNNVFGASKS